MQPEPNACGSAVSALMSSPLPMFLTDSSIMLAVSLRVSADHR